MSIEWIAAAFGVLGTTLLAWRGRHAGWGFVAFLASNAGWIVFAIDADHHGLLTQQLVFTATSLIGVWRWLIQPALHRRIDAGETLVGADDLYTELLAAQAEVLILRQRNQELERHLEIAARDGIPRASRD